MQLTYRTYNMHDPASGRYLTDTASLYDMPRTRGEDPKAALEDGAQHVRKLFEPRRIQIKMTLLCNAVATALDTAKGVFTTRTPSNLTWTRDDESVLVIKAEVLGFTAKYRSPKAVDIVFDFSCSDPFWTSEYASTGAIEIDTSPKAITVNSLGNYETTKISVSIAGPAVNPKIENLANNEWMKFNGTLQGGDVLNIDCNQLTATHTTTEEDINAVGSLEFSGSKFMTFDPGQNQLAVTSDATGGSITIGWLDCYL